jgi:hypothetical protein
MRMERRTPSPIQLGLQLRSQATLSLDGVTHQEIVQLLARLLASALGGHRGADPGAADETR